MCGIVGKIHFDPQHPVDARQIRAMADSVRHRGPDDDGIWTDRNVGLGHRRLSIIDLSASGRNPMCNEDESVWIVFNGEIYNFQELRPGLEAAGHKFRSKTDTEVILHLYEELGPLCVQQLRGMFAFAIWDRHKQVLLLARDRLGVKPLHYALTSSGLLFGSEIKAVLSTGEVDREPDLQSLHQFLLWQCIPSPRTGFRGVRKLPPASILTWQPGKEIRIQKYWDLDSVPNNGEYDLREPSSFKASALAQQVRDLVQESTRIRLNADVPVGLFLSGGIDSACVLAATRKEISGTISTFSVTFGDPKYDESHYARLLADAFATEHHEFRVTPNVMEMLPEMAALFDEPFADESAIPTYYLAKLTSEHVKVALSGDGGDEAFGGYQRYLALKMLVWLSKVPGASQLSALGKLLPYISTSRSKLRYGKELLSLVGRAPEQQYRAMFLGMLDEQRWMAGYTDSFRESIEATANDEGFLQGWALPSMPDDLSRAMASDTLGYIPECLNVKVDMASMACGLEVRSPFLDYKLIEFCARVPSAMKIRKNEQKYILKRAFKDELPSAILNREKTGFGMPLAEWLRHDLRAITHDTLLSVNSCISTLFRTEEIRRMLDEHSARKHNWQVQLWRLLVLESWMKANSTRGRTPHADSKRDPNLDHSFCPV
jgi:asparagine synthase (glutamine-hydrolysing)